MTPRRRRILKVVGALAGGLALAVSAFSVWVEHVIAEEPLLATRPAILDEPLRDEPGVRRLGRAWLRILKPRVASPHAATPGPGLRVLRLAGDPFELGYQNARLSSDALERLEDVLFRARDAFVPSSSLRWVLRKLILFRHRALPDFISSERKLEILGLAKGSPPDRHADEAPLYHRIMGYHAIHDVAHLLIDSPFVRGHYDEMRAGCTGFAAVGGATADGRALLARNFDFEAGRVFDEEKVVLVVEPDGGIPFLSVAWSGMAGAVTGVNRAGIAVALNAGASDDDASIGTPVSLVVREVLERAKTLDDAIAIVRAAHVFVSDSFIVASADERRVAVIERSPGRCAVREDPALVTAANHFRAPEFANDSSNGRRRRDATTEERLARLEDLVAARRGRFTVPLCVEVLRDRGGPGGADVGLGNRGAIDALIATHSVVIDATARTIWVSEAPHTLGRYVPIALDEVLAKDALPDDVEARAIPGDPLLGNGGYEKHLRKRRALIAARDALSAGDLAKARALALEARELDPRFFEPEELLARIETEAGDPARAKEHARAALDRAPPFAAVREEMQALLAK